MPMDRSEAERIVKANLGPLAEAMCVGHWKITVEFGRCSNPNWSAECTRVAEYEKAWITIDPECLNTEAAVLESLRHELFHIVLAPFDLYRDAMTRAIEPDSAAERQEVCLWRSQVEKAVLNMERLWKYSQVYWLDVLTAPPAPPR